MSRSVNAGPSMMVVERRLEDVVVLSLSRSLKGAGEEALKERIDRLVHDGFTRILIDLRDVPYLDSSDLGRLIRCHIAVRQAGGRVRICNLSDRVQTLMKLTRLETVLELYETEETALAAMREPQALRTAVGSGADGTP